MRTIDDLIINLKGILGLNFSEMLGTTANTSKLDDLKRPREIVLGSSPRPGNRKDLCSRFRYHIFNPFLFEVPSSLRPRGIHNVRKQK